MGNLSAPSDEQAFPVLNVSQIAKLRPFGTAREHRAGEVLIELGDEIPGRFVVLDGETEPLRRANDDRVIRTSGPGAPSGSRISECTTPALSV